jgi:hypothetical protein
MNTRREELLARLRAWAEAHCPGALADPQALERLAGIVEEEVDSGRRTLCWKARRILSAPCDQ